MLESRSTHQNYVMSKHSFPKKQRDETSRFDEIPTTFSSEFNSELEDLVPRLDSVRQSKDAKGSLTPLDRHSILSY